MHLSTFIISGLFTGSAYLLGVYRGRKQGKAAAFGPCPEYEAGVILGDRCLVIDYKRQLWVSAPISVGDPVLFTPVHLFIKDSK